MQYSFTSQWKSKHVMKSCKSTWDVIWFYLVKIARNIGLLSQQSIGAQKVCSYFYQLCSHTRFLLEQLVWDKKVKCTISLSIHKPIKSNSQKAKVNVTKNYSKRGGKRNKAKRGNCTGRENNWINEKRVHEYWMKSTWLKETWNLNERHEGYWETLNKYTTMKDAAWVIRPSYLINTVQTSVFHMAPIYLSIISNSAPSLRWCKKQAKF